MSTFDLIKSIARETEWSPDTVREILEAASKRGWIRNPGESISPADIRKGDRVRIEYVGGTVTELVASGDPWMSVPDRTYFLLDRPKPKLPTEPGSVIRVGGGGYFTLARNGTWWNGKISLNPDFFDGKNWEFVA